MLQTMLENGVDEEALSPQRAALLKMLLAAFDKNKNGKIDPEERKTPSQAEACATVTAG